MADNNYTVILCDGKYEFDVADDTGLMTAARRNSEDWPAGREWGGSKAVMAMLRRIHELEIAQAENAERLFLGGIDD